jgi:hypothetical protein
MIVKLEEMGFGMTMFFFSIVQGIIINRYTLDHLQLQKHHI